MQKCCAKRPITNQNGLVLLYLNVICSYVESLCCLQVAEWQTRAEKFEEMCCSVIQMFTRLSNSANRTILYDLYPYIWDIKSIISMVKSFVQWLGMYEWNRNTPTL